MKFALKPLNPDKRGFTLVELAIVLFIVALLLGGMMNTLGSQVEQQKIKETQRILDEAKEVLIGFATAHGRLPCPDTDIDGAENVSAPVITNNSPVAGQSTQVFSACLSAEGDFPFSTAGTSRLDGWGHRLRYRVTPAFGQSSIIWSGLNATGSTVSVAPGFILTTTGNINIQTRGDNPATPSPSIETKFASNLAANVPAIVISHGKNGYGARDMDGISLPGAPSSNLDEIMNTNPASATKISRIITQQYASCSDTAEGLPSCEFDDLVTWLSPNILFNRMIAAGRLP
jgi:prepilin-type N-terminal cleavage/methylation domain-containing protein